MPTIEHLLLPQIEKKQEEIAAALPRPSGYLTGVDLNAPGVVVPEVPTPTPTPPGYLTATAPEHMWMDMPLTKEQSRGRAYVAPPSKLADERPAMQAYANAIGYLPNTPGWLQFKNRAIGGSVGGGDARYMQQQERIVPPTGAIPAQRGDKHAGIVLQLPAGAPVGYAEDGQMVDRKGKKLGYLAEDRGAYRTLERGRADVKIAAPPPGETSVPETDAFGRKVFDDVYRPYLKALDENDGRWPDGIFKGTTKKERDAIHEGVVELRKRDRGEKL